MFQPVDFEFVDGLQLGAEFSRREPFSGEPDEVGFRQVEQPLSGMFAEGHARRRQFQQLPVVNGWNVHGTGGKKGQVEVLPRRLRFSSSIATSSAKL